MNNNITNIEEYRPHKVSEVICVFCGYRALSVRPVDVLLKNLECGGCRKVGGVIDTGEVLEEEE